MNFVIALAFVFTLSGSVSASQIAAASSSESQLEKVARGADAYGDLIYEGTVFQLNGDHTQPLYHYERRVRREGAEQFSTSFTHDAQKIALVEVASHDANYNLHEYTEYQFQLGQVGKVTIKDNTAQFRVVRGSVEEEAHETVSLPVVVGPTMYGFIYQNWESLLSGKTVDFRFAVMSRLETVGFQLKKVNSSDKNVRLQMKAKSPFIALLVNPIYFNFTSGKSLISLEGRVPTKLKVDNKWTDLDAFVEYKNITLDFK